MSEIDEESAVGDEAIPPDMGGEGGRRLHVVFLSHYFAPEGNAPASRTYEHCKRWVAAGHRVTVITGVPNVPDGKVYPGYRNRLCQTEWIDGIRVLRVWTFIAPNKGTARRIANYLSYMVTATLRAVFVKKPDVVIATSPQFFCACSGAVVALVRRRPFVLEVRDIWPESIEAVGAPVGRLAIRALAGVERWLYRSAKFIICVGDGYRRKLVERGVPESKIGVVTNGADIEQFQPGERDAEMAASWRADGRFSVAYIGTLGMACGLEVVIEAAARLKAKGDLGVQFVCIGDGARREELEEDVARRSLENVTFTGRLGKALIPTALRTADACLVHLRDRPLFETVLPSKMFEAFAVARPVILGVRGDAAEILAQAGAGIAISPESADELIAAIETLRNSPQMAAEYGANGRCYAERNLDRDQLAEQMMLYIFLEVVHPPC